MNAFAVGALFLIDSDVPGFGIPLPLIAALTAASGVFILIVAAMAAKARRRPVVNMVAGGRALIGASGELLEFARGEGWALIGGEHWKVRAAGDLLAGQPVRVTGADGVMLDVAALGTDPAETKTGGTT